MLLNRLQVPSFAASAVTGGGVLQTLTACCKQVLQDLKRKSVRTEQAVSSKPKPDISSASSEVESKVAAPAPKNGLTEAATALKFPKPQKAPLKTAPLKIAPLKTEPQNLKNSVTTSKEAVIETNQPTNKAFKPEIAQVGKPRLIDPYTITLPLRLSTDADQHNLLSVNITFSINDFH